MNIKNHIMKYALSLCFLSLLCACTREKAVCVAKSADGTEMYVVEGDDLCEDQISQDNGEYCECNWR